ncbi:protein of unknown function [Azospirillum baldaniorum]|uniref:Uncharacterized protein n=1 Tax=Azospirillum baldaniorum TaxID=1064539 RepID=A0A9P1NMK6_9PROT|nr:protein of unknown function [Azospirillum baldaniorum]
MWKQCWDMAALRVGTAPSTSCCTPVPAACTCNPEEPDHAAFHTPFRQIASMPSEGPLMRGSLALAAGLLAGLWLDTRRRTNRAEQQHPPTGHFMSVGGTRLHYLDHGKDSASPPRGVPARQRHHRRRLGAEPSGRGGPAPALRLLRPAPAMATARRRRDATPVPPPKPRCCAPRPASWGWSAPSSSAIRWPGRWRSPGRWISRRRSAVWSSCRPSPTRPRGSTSSP